jgi:Leucine-rich repeat (LRR) protein
MLDQLKSQLPIKIEENKLKYDFRERTFDGFTLNIEKVLKDKILDKNWFRNHIVEYYKKEKLLILLIRILQTTRYDREINKLQLTGLVISNGIEEALRLIINHTSIKELSIQENLSTLPPYFGEFNYLVKLDLHSNKFKGYIPKQLNNIESLLEINLSKNNLSSIPKSILNLKLLKKLNLSHNKFQKLLDFIGKLQSLEFLDLSNNELTALPDSICNLKSLKYLNLSDNLLRELPSRRGNLSSLVEFDLSWYNIVEIPQSIRGSENLKIIRVETTKLVIIRKLLKPLKENKKVLIKYKYPRDSEIIVKELSKKKDLVEDL